MDLKAYLIIKKIKEQFSDYGKIYQKLLSLTFVRAGKRLLEEKSIQGIDLIIETDGKKYAVEVKTTDGDEVVWAEKEIDDIERAKGLGFIPALAALKISPLANWVIASSCGLSKGTVKIGMLCQTRIPQLEEGINERYAEVVLDIGKKLLDENPASPQDWLNEVIRPYVVGK